MSLHSLSPDVTAPPTSTVVTLTVNGDAAKGSGGPKTTLVSAMGVVTISWTGLDLSAHATGTAAVVELAVSAAVGIALPLKLRFHLGEWGCLASDSVSKMDLCA